MNLKTLLSVTITATLLATASMTGAASAQTGDPVIQSIVTDLSASGFSQIRIIKKATKIEVIATGPTGSVERTYSYAGDLLKEEAKPTGGAAAGTGAGVAGTDTGMDTGMDGGMDDGTGMDDGGADDDMDDGADSDHGGRDGGDSDHGGRDGGDSDHGGRDGGDSDHGERDGGDSDHGERDDD